MVYTDRDSFCIHSLLSAVNKARPQYNQRKSIYGTGPDFCIIDGHFRNLILHLVSEFYVRCLIRQQIITYSLLLP